MWWRIIGKKSRDQRWEDSRTHLYIRLPETLAKIQTKAFNIFQENKMFNM